MNPGALRLAYYGDDFTGSTDALEFLTRAGARSALFIQPPSAEQLSRYPGLQALGVAGLTRSMPPAQMEAELRPAFTALRALGAPHVHYKVCSTFDSSPTVGSIGRALEVGREIFRSPFVPLLVGAPALGRYCVFGNLFARMGIGSAGEIHRLDRHPSMSRHPVTPSEESDLRLHLAKQTALRSELFSILELDLPEPELHSAFSRLLAQKPEIVLFDLLTEAQLPRLGLLLDSCARSSGPLFSVGSSSVEMALGAYWSGLGELKPVSTWPEPGPAKPLLVLSGSCSPVTTGQIAWAVDNGFRELALDAAALASGCDLTPYVENLVSSLSRGESVVAHTSRGTVDRSLQGEALTRLGAALGRIALKVFEGFPLKRLLLAGGDSSSHAARALGIEALEMLAPLAPGAPLCRASAPGSPADGCEINFKGGQVGAPDYFGSVARGRL